MGAKTARGIHHAEPLVKISPKVARERTERLGPSRFAQRSFLRAISRFDGRYRTLGTFQARFGCWF